MKRVVMVMAIALLASSMAFAGSFDFYTTGSFSASGTSSATFTNGGFSSTLAFTGTPTSMSTYGFTQDTGATGANVSLGSFTMSGNCTTGAGCDGAAAVQPTGTFTLSLYQTVPAGGTPNPGTLVGNLTGNLILNSSTGEWQMQLSDPNPAIKISSGGGIVTIYALQALNTSTNGCTLNHPCVNINNVTQASNINALVTQVPEPGSMLLFGTGLTGLAGLIRRRTKKR